MSEITQSRREDSQGIYAEAYQSMQEFALSTLRTEVISESVQPLKNTFVTQIIARVTVDLHEVRNGLEREKRRIEELRRKEAEMKLRQKEQELDMEKARKRELERRRESEEVEDVAAERDKKWYRYIDISYSQSSTLLTQILTPQISKAKYSGRLFQREIRARFQLPFENSVLIGIETAYAEADGSNGNWTINFPSPIVIDGKNIASLKNFQQKTFLVGITSSSIGSPSISFGAALGYAKASFDGTSMSNLQNPVDFKRDALAYDGYVALRVYVWAIGFSGFFGVSGIVDDERKGITTLNFYAGLGASLSLVFDVM
ncbi:MAG: hypothetical protein NZM06_09475 [Chloroherpetonaceae bacterium]|nr:hypothetical protein [Chloroherpetonaceae bacterium]